MNKIMTVLNTFRSFQKIPLKRCLVSSFILVSMLNNVSAQEFNSGPTVVSLVELYTSEGCSSCPPADRWLGQLKDSDSLWKAYVPLAFHVDYWDYIGWKDPFASQEYSQRQRRYARESDESTVYTPGVRKGGKEWRSWYLNGAKELSNAHATESSVGVLKVIADGDSFEASFSQAKPGTQLNLAVLGLDLSTQVTRGENHGKTLDHEFVVLGLSKYVSAENGLWRGELPPISQSAPKYALAAWVSEGASQQPIQATGGYLVRTE